MKKFLYITIAVLTIGIGFTSCKKDKKGNNLPGQINSIITAQIIDTLKKHGTIINAGTTPPTVSGIFYDHPNYCTYDGTGDTLKHYSDYYYRFSKQNNSQFTIRVDYETPNGVDRASDTTATFISGSGNKFSIFVKATGTTYNIPYVALAIFSGTITSTGIENLQNTYYFESKGNDPNGYLVPAGTIRVFHDKDGFSELVDNVVFPEGTPTTTLNSLNAPDRLMKSIFFSSGVKNISK